MVRLPWNGTGTLCAKGGCRTPEGHIYLSGVLRHPLAQSVPVPFHGRLVHPRREEKMFPVR